LPLDDAGQMEDSPDIVKLLDHKQMSLGAK
jgi:hypothetical protein